MQKNQRSWILKPSQRSCSSLLCAACRSLWRPTQSCKGRLVQSACNLEAAAGQGEASLQSLRPVCTSCIGAQTLTWMPLCRLAGLLQGHAREDCAEHPRSCAPHGHQGATDHRHCSRAGPQGGRRECAHQADCARSGRAACYQGRSVSAKAAQHIPSPCRMAQCCALCACQQRLLPGASDVQLMPALKLSL